MSTRKLCTMLGLLALLLIPGWAGAQAEKPVEATGDWEMTVETPFGNFTSVMKLQREGAEAFVKSWRSLMQRISERGGSSSVARRGTG